MVEKLTIWMDAKKWRTRNGYTTPEWEMYVNNTINLGVISIVLSCCCGMVAAGLIL